jgi:hypothetical protein
MRQISTRQQFCCSEILVDFVLRMGVEYVDLIHVNWLVMLAWHGIDGTTFLLAAVRITV